MFIEVTDYKKFLEDGRFEPATTLNGIPLKVGADAGMIYYHFAVVIRGREFSVEFGTRKVKE